MLTKTYNAIYSYCVVEWLFAKIKNKDATPFALADVKKIDLTPRLRRRTGPAWGV